MDEPFNPYVEWLGLTESTIRPDHYRLLGLPPFASDARSITAACDGMLAKVRANRPGVHLRHWQALLDELTAARNCLLDDSLRSKYDAQLRGGDESQELSSSSSVSASAGSNPTSVAGYMWPPGFEPPATKSASAPSAPAPISSTPFSNATPVTSPSSPSVPTTSASFYPPAPQVERTAPATPAAVPVLSPVSFQTTAPAAWAATPVVPASETSSAPNPAAPVQPTAAWAQPAAQATGFSQGNFANPGYANGGYASGGLPPASPVPATAMAMPLPPGSPYGMQGVDPMAPVVSPVGAPQGIPGAMPVAQPIGGYAQAVPAAYAGGPYGQPYAQPAAQPVGMPYNSPVAQAMPVSGMAVGAIPVASAAGMNAGQAMPLRAAMPVQAIGAHPVEPDVGLKVPSTSASKTYKQSRQKNSVSTAIAALLAASMLVITAFFVFLKDGNILAQKPPKDASELPIPTNVPPPVDPYSSPSTTVILAPLGDEETSSKKPWVRRPKSTIGPLVEDDQTPETIPLVTPEMPNTATPESVVPEMKVPEKTPMPETTAPVSTASPEEISAVRKSLGKAIMSMGYRDWDTAKEKLAEAKALAKDEVLGQKVEAVESVFTGVEEFWRAVRESTKSLGAGQELVIGNTRVAVVEANDKLLILRVGGQNKRYPLDDLPMGLARTLASTWFDNNAPSTKVFTGAFLYVEPNGDPSEVRQLWQAAQQGGVNVDLLMSLLEDADLKTAGRDEADKS